MGAAVSKKNTQYINENWDKLKCSPIGIYLQMAGIAPGNPNDTATQCRSNEFSAQFNGSMSEHLNVTNKLTNNLGMVTTEITSIRMVLANIQQQAFNDLSIVATQIINIYIKIGSLFMLMMRQFSNILGIFKETINVGASSVKLLIEFIDLLRVPINGMISFIGMFKRKL